MTFCRAASLDDLWIGEIMGIKIRGRDVLLVNLDGEVRAYEDRCAHKGLPLHHGRLSDGVITCPAHGWQYDLTTGRGVNPERVLLCSFVVKIEGNDVLVNVDESGTNAH
jgi:toluene monooxygenase system ferredoxin subunit